MEQIRVFLAHDHALVRDGLRALVEGQRDMAVVGEASGAAEAVGMATHCAADVLVMDLVMPGLTAVRTTQALLAGCPRARVLILTVHEDPTYLSDVLGAGASGYVLKRSGGASLISAIRKVAAGEIYLDTGLGELLVEGGAVRSRSVGEQTGLSEREAVVLRLIAQGYSNKEIAARLDLSVKTVETYKARAMEKLGFGSRVEIVRYAAIHGWLSQP